ncbi:putative RNA-binding Zn ribbon-like protein [Psychromicrobium silvestre]|uniref:Putative RNA-binding Zn ribbon-like protein n=1 Tax=Psychromicrobium silvestre TaxID=1645614 RepID=A0A7Y9LUV6_9MICC|nr:CGNR zinc finger domain-containing protein [Psychromicrobium silvestre]NYE95999.1 putative RNA-binding Zn ribbon-like protein [Psychromicrobium silvestre]
MLFAPDTESALRSAVALVNTLPSIHSGQQDRLETPADLDRFVEQEQFSGARTHDAAELAAVQALRPPLRELWLASEEGAVERVNAILQGAKALPQLIKHDGLDWHLHATSQQAPLAERMAVEAAMAMVDVIRSQELDRLRICAASDCADVLIDLSKNRSRRFCDTGNCANRAHVAAYRARKAAD